jgi:hypothetical protein
MHGDKCRTCWCWLGKTGYCLQILLVCEVEKTNFGVLFLCICTERMSIFSSWNLSDIAIPSFPDGSMID